MESNASDIAEEAALVRKARWGSQSAFELLYRRHAQAIHALALRLTGDAAAAEDITQDTFLRMLRFLGGLRSDRPLRPWLKQVATNAAIDRLRRDKTYRQEELTAEHPSLDEIASSVIASSDAERMLRQLPPLARAVVWLHTSEGWSHEQLARRFGYTESWSKSLVARSLLRLREQAATPTNDDRRESPRARPAAMRTTP